MNGWAIAGIILGVFIALCVGYYLFIMLFAVWTYIAIRHGDNIRGLPRTLGRTLARPFTLYHTNPYTRLVVHEPVNGVYDMAVVPQESVIQPTLRSAPRRTQKPLIFGTISNEQMSNIFDSNGEPPPISFAKRSLVSRVKRSQHRRSRKHRQRIQ